MQRYDSNAIRDNLNIAPAHQTPAPGIDVFVKIKSTGVMAAIFEEDETTPKSNPLTTDALGNFWFYAANDRYRIEFSTGDVRPDEILFDSSDVDIRFSLLDNPLLHIFKKNKLEDTINGSITWSRSTTATYTDLYGIVRTAPINDPRVESNGWLAEGASTNLCLHSEDLGNASWLALDGAVVTTNTSIAPDGNMTADNCDFSAQVISRVAQQISAVGGLPYTFSIYVKSTPGKTFGLNISSVGGTFIESSNTIVTDGTAQRVSVSVILNADNTGLFATIGGSLSQQSDFDMWGAQIEQLPAFTSYIPTVAASETRTQDNVTSDLYGNMPDISKDFSVVFDVSLLMPFSDGVIERLFNANSDQFFIQVSNGVVVSGNLSSSAGTAITSEKAQIGVVSKDGITTVYVDGLFSVGTAVSYSTQSSGSLYFGQSFVNNLHANCNILDFRAYDFALNIDELAFLSEV